MHLDGALNVNQKSNALVIDAIIGAFCLRPEIQSGPEIVLSGGRKIKYIIEYRGGREK